MKVLVACEYSQVVTKAFRDRGHEAYSCDILPTEGNPDWHFQADIFHVLHRPDGYKWDLIIAHPPCTRLCNSGVRWLAERNLWEDMRQGALFFKALLNANCDKICIENPVMHKHALEIIGKKHTQSIQPYEFGHTTSKRTCLWLKGLPLLKPTNIIPKEQRTQEIWLASPGPNRWKKRSKTFEGIANAMADQWGSLNIKATA